MLTARVSPDARVKAGEAVALRLALARMHLFHPETGMAV